MSTLFVDNISSKTGTSQALTIDSSGQITLPAIPFLRMKVASATSVAAPTGSGTVPFNTVIDSRGITLNTTTYKFQVPVSGLYHFSGAVRWNRVSSYLWWRVEDGSGTEVQSGALVLANSNSGSFTTSSGSFVCPLTASTDYKIGFGDGANSTSNINGGQTFMTIYLVG